MNPSSLLDDVECLLVVVGPLQLVGLFAEQVLFGEHSSSAVIARRFCAQDFELAGRLGKSETEAEFCLDGKLITCTHNWRAKSRQR